MAEIQFQHSRPVPPRVDPLKAGQINGHWRLEDGDVGVALDLSRFRFRALGLRSGAPLSNSLVQTPGGAPGDLAAVAECSADGRNWDEFATLTMDQPQAHPPQDKPFVRARGVGATVLVELAARSDRG